MAMTKAEKQLLQTFRERASLTLPPYEEPKPMKVAPDLKKLTIGWFTNGYGEVSQGCSDGYNHSRWSTEKTNSQGPGCMYETKLDALRAMRWRATERAMKELGGIDALIEREAALAEHEKEMGK